LVSGISTRITNDTATDGNPLVSPDGNTVVWEHCPSSLTNCDIWQAVKSGGVWTASAVAATTNPEGNPDTNGSFVVYDSQRAGNSDIFWRATTGGAEFQLQLAGVERNPSIAGHLISFESAATIFDTSDIFVYDMSTNLLYQITNTPLVTEQLNGITVLPDGRVRVVWSSDEDGADQRNIRAVTFSLPLTGPTPSDLIQQLLDTVATYNLRNGIANSFDVKLQNAATALAAAKSGDYVNACGMLSAFLSEVQAQSGKAITVAQAATLTNLANQARTSIGCP